MQDLGTTTPAGDVAVEETNRLIASNKVEGTAVYDPQGERLGSIYNFMVDKRSGQAEYAVMSFGGLAPHYARGAASEWRDPEYGRRVDEYYRLRMYEGMAGPMV
jgi:PRC-barrel domain